jgi:hypothetical protein
MDFTINLTLNVNINYILLKKIPTLINVGIQTSLRVP